MFVVQFWDQEGFFSCLLVADPPFPLPDTSGCLFVRSFPGRPPLALFLFCLHPFHLRSFIVCFFLFFWKSKKKMASMVLRKRSFLGSEPRCKKRMKMSSPRFQKDFFILGKRKIQVFPRRIITILSDFFFSHHPFFFFLFFSRTPLRANSVIGHNPDIVYYIFQFLPFPSLVKMSQVSKQWQLVSQEDLLWRNLCFKNVA